MTLGTNHVIVTTGMCMPMLTLSIVVTTCLKSGFSNSLILLPDVRDYTPQIAGGHEVSNKNASGKRQLID